MKKNLRKTLSVFFLRSVLCSCKKDLLNDENNASLNKQIIKLSQDYYVKSFEQNPNSKDKKSLQNNIYNTGKILWDHPQFFDDIDVIVFETSLKSNSLKKYLKIQLNTNGDIINESFLFIWFDINSAKSINSFKLSKNFITKINIPTSFEGVVLEYDLKNKLLSSKNFSTAFQNKETKSSLSFNENVKDDIDTQNTYARCINWYLLTYVNGILVSEEYVGTTCDGTDPQEWTDTIDGAGGGGNGILTLDIRTIEKLLVIADINTYPQQWKATATFSLTGNTYQENTDFNVFTNLSVIGYGVINSSPATGGPGVHSPVFIENTQAPHYCIVSFGDVSIAPTNQGKSAYGIGQFTAYYPNMNFTMPRSNYAIYSAKTDLF